LPSERFTHPTIKPDMPQVTAPLDLDKINIIQYPKRVHANIFNLPALHTCTRYSLKIINFDNTVAAMLYLKI
jgi:hypothetical protein